MARHQRHEKRKHRAVKGGRCAPAVIPVTARFKSRFEIAARHRRDEEGLGGN